MSISVACRYRGQVVHSRFAVGYVLPSWILVVVVACAAMRSTPTSATPPSIPTSDRIIRYSEDRQALSVKHKEPMSEFRNSRMQEFLRTQMMDLEAVDSKQLSGSEAVDFVLLRNELKYKIAKAKYDQARDQSVRQLLGCLVPLVKLLEQHEQTHAVDAKSTAELFVATSANIKKLIIELQNAAKSETVATESDSATALHAADSVTELLRSLDSLNRFYSGYNPLYSWWCALPYESVVKDCNALLAVLKQISGATDDPDQIIGHAIGDEMMLVELQHEMIPYTPAELIEIAEREFKWCDEQMATASRDLGFGDDWQSAMEWVKQKHVAPGDQPAMIHRLAAETIAFLKAGDMVTVPPLCEEVWRMEMMTPARQRINPFFLGGDTIIVSYPTDAMTHEEKLMSMRGNNEHFARATVHHELIPGHHLQLFSTKRYRPYRREFETPFWIEGWALYWEMLLWDKGFARSPEDRVGMLFWRKHRCARIIFSLGFQLGRMTPEQCVEYLIERVGHEPANASAEVRRSVMGGYPPLYQAAYMLGGLQIRALRAELVDSGKMTERDFHDAILREGPIPIAMVRAALTGQIDENPGAWRFADAPK
ncbi:MAG TPA: DUF885 domain-containing protein [Planctomycetaceae bacterium]|nr:DUF885 domain-containing protein [Planctomycetaceae bacterium]